MCARLACFALTIAVMTAHAQNTTTLADLRDHARPLLIFAGQDDSRARSQIADLTAHRDAVRERDMRILLLAPNARAWHDRSALPEETVSQEEEQRLRKRFRISPDEFAVILVGKDGGEKLRSDKPIAWEKLASKIDAMPMRQDEMRAR